jgi:hypothetical protein
MSTVRQLPGETGVIVTLRGEPYRMDMNFNALALIEEETGISLMSGADLKAALSSVKNIRVIIWACLVDHQPNMTKQDVGRLCGLDNMNELLAAIDAVISQALPNAKNSDTPNGTGKRKAKSTPPLRG